MKNQDALQMARVVRVFNHGTNVQLLCIDEWGLISVYFEQQNFNLFNKVIHRLGLSLKGLSIWFNRDIVQVSNPHNKHQIYPVLRKTRTA